ncbi:phage replisome organizer N-terminal domain-containing protein [Pediococcus inopinatus]|uniref:phage replisome organizer N-terminal domain-containing protein n=1 Tax=Pediococcus inopinatus TaxID=114090 RepID=UPI0007C5C9EC|nr:phage replisome organizer N-terminal domain-containing protein [Pediococcus inopinatus]
MADVSWIKFKTDMFEDEKIKLIQAMPESDAILIVWIRLLTLAGKVNDDGRIYIQKDLAYTDEELATLFDKPLNVIRLALQTLSRFNMISINQNGLLKIKNWEKHQNVDGLDRIRQQTAERTKRYRERKKSQKLLKNSDVTVTSRDATEVELDKDKESNREAVNFKKLIEYFNMKSGKHFRDVESNRKLIRARLNDGYSKADIKRVIDIKSAEWRDDPEHYQYLQPSTLFAPSHFDNYLNQGSVSEPQGFRKQRGSAERERTAEDAASEEEADLKKLEEEARGRLNE